LDIQICQCCGIIIRGKSKFCTGCGTTISKFSPITLPLISHTAAPLAVTLEPDPLVLERTMIKMRYAHLPAAAPSLIPGGSDGNGHGNGDGNGHGPNGNGDGNGHGYAAPAIENAGQAAQASSSKLQNILGNASSRGFAAGAAAAAGMVSYDSEDATGQFDPGAAYGNGAEEGAMLAPAQQMEFAPQQAAFAHGTGIAPMETQQDYASPQRATYSRIVTTAGAFDALAGSTAVSATIPVTVTTALSPGLDAGAVIATNLSAAPSMVPITSAEPPVGSPTATSIPNTTTVVAPQTGSPESVPMGPPPAEPAPQPAGAVAPTPKVFESSNSSPVGQPAADPGMVPPAANGAPDFFSSAPATLAQPAATTQATAEPTPAVSADGPPPVMNPAELSPPPVSQQPAAEAPAAEPEPELVIAPPTVSSPTSESAGVPLTNAPNPAAGQQATFNPVASSFDFFAPQNPFPVVSSNSEAAAPSLGNLATADSPKAEQGGVLDAKKFSNGVPSVVQDAMRAAASASQTNLKPVSDMNVTTSTETDDKTKIVSEEEFPDESVKRGQRKEETKDETAARQKKEREESPSRRRSRAGKGDEEEKAPKEPEKTIKLGTFEMKTKTALTAAILLLFLGLPVSIFVLNLAGRVISSIAGPAAPQMVLGGDWKFGIEDNGVTVKAQVNLKQNGNNFTGIGVDRYGQFRVENGVFQYPKIQFAKVYVDEQFRQKGKAIVYAGTVDWVNPDPNAGNMPFFSHMYGVWQVSKRQGYGWRGKPVTITGKWEAGQTSIQRDGNVVAGGGIPGTGGVDASYWFKKYFLGFKDPNNPGASEWPIAFMRIAGFLLLIGLGLVFASVRLFGPAGTININAKKEYIPSQFKSQHHKMVFEFGKSLKPGGLPLGWRADWNIFGFWLPRRLNLPPETRTQNPHIMVLGAGSKGKSRLIASMIHHDIESNDRAVVVIDSDGTLIDQLMAKIASSPKGHDIAKRLIIIDPTHGGDVFAYNPLEYPEDGDLQNAASAVVFGFKAIYTEPPGSQSQWNQQTANILRNAAILLMANGKTLTDLPVLLSENDFRDVLLEKVERLKNEKAEYTTLLEAWAQYKRLARTDQWINWVEPILNRVQPMLGDPRIRPILTKTKGDLNLKEIISEGKILFVKIPQGQLDQNANLLGSLIVTGLKQAAMSLSLKGSSRKHQCALYLDEFDNFIEKETFDAITSETKKFQIGFIGSSKTLQGLPEDYRNQIIINVGTLCCFALAKKDGDMLGPQMFRVDGRKIKNQTLQNIFNKVNTSPQFELISDEEKLNIDRVVGQEERHFFCYRVGTVAGVFQMRSLEFNDVPDKDVNWTLIDQIYARSVPKD
jgi:hypothetical protein